AARRAPALARDVLRLAPAVAVRPRAAPPALAAPPRAPHLPRRRHLPLVAGDPRLAVGRREGRVPLRRLRARLPARAPARAHPARHLLLLRPRAPHVGARPARRPADRGRDDGGRGGGGLLRRVRPLPAALPAGGAGGGAAHPRGGERFRSVCRASVAERTAGGLSASGGRLRSSSRSAGAPARSSRLRSASASTAAPRRSATAASQ